MRHPTPVPLTPSASEQVTREAPETPANDAPPTSGTTHAEPSPYLAGEVIGDRYRLVREIGSGGMGVVWVAHSLVLGVDVALKLIRASIAGPAVSSRMAREAHAAARLGHPALVRVFDFGWTSRGDPFLVMELVLGETLSALLQREIRLPAIRAVQMLLPIADGVRLAHDKSIIHRDIKPDNIFLSTEALGRMQPKLLDFGIAKIGRTSRESRLTQVGVVLGSPEYMSPEQAQGLDDIDERTDVWSLCVVLYEMLTGSTPFKTNNYNALMQAIINKPALPITDFGVGDEAIWRVLERGLRKDRDERWSNMTELGEGLALWLYEHGIKEDLSGNSVRALWLDTGLGGIRIDVPESSFPTEDTRPRAPVIAEEQLEDLPQQFLVTDRPDSNTASSGVTQMGRRSRRHQRKMVLWSAAAVTVAVAATLFLVFRPRSTTPVVSAPEPRTTVETAPAPPPTSTDATATATAAASTNVAAADGLGEPPSSTSSHVQSTLPAAAGAKRPVVKGAAPTKPVPRPGKRSHDFGF